MKRTLTALAIGAFAAGLPVLAAAQSVEITHDHDRPGRVGDPEVFSGTAYVAPVFGPQMNNVTGGEVTFLPGARSAWHTHPAGQILVVTAGTGWTQERGQPKQIITAGDVVWCPPGVEHWHGAADDTAMTHYAIQAGVDGVAVNWGDLVSDEDYLN